MNLFPRRLDHPGNAWSGSMGIPKNAICLIYQQIEPFHVGNPMAYSLSLLYQVGYKPFCSGFVFILTPFDGWLLGRWLCHWVYPLLPATVPTPRTTSVTHWYPKVNCWKKMWKSRGFKRNMIWLVVFRHPSEKYESVGMTWHSQLNGKNGKS